MGKGRETLICLGTCVCPWLAPAHALTTTEPTVSAHRDDGRSHQQSSLARLYTPEVETFVTGFNLFSHFSYILL